MTRPDLDYYSWLVSQIQTPTNRRKYDELFWKMHNTEFIWIIPNDDNRIADGSGLRYEYNELNATILRLDHEWVSFLEVLVALSRRVSFAAGGTPESWAWRLIKNLSLNRMFDPLAPGQVNTIDNVLRDVIWRTYESDGSGGFFPLKNPREDQRKVEIWDQMNAFVTEVQHL